MKKHVKDVLMIILGNLIMGFAYAKLMVPNKIINGGVTSLSLIFEKIIHVPITTINNILLFLLLVLTAFFLGRELFLKSIVSSVAYSIFFAIFYYLPFTITITPVFDLLLASILIAFGYFACLSSNGSTVGVDVFALILVKYYPKMNLSLLIRLFNMVILFFGFTVYGLISIVWGIIFAFCYSHILDFMLKSAFKLKEG